MKIHHWLPLIVLAAGCPTTDCEKCGSGDTAGGECPEGEYDGPITIVGAEVSCTGSTVRFAAETEGLTGDGRVFTQETRSESEFGQWSDNHTIETYEFDAVCGAFDRLEREIQDGTTLDEPVNDWQQDESSVFTCGGHYNDNDFVTFMFGVMDQSGNLADCFGFGHDVEGLAAGNYDDERVGDDPDFDISDCRPGQEGI